VKAAEANRMTVARGAGVVTYLMLNASA
jgi:hypothetical protein